MYCAQEEPFFPLKEGYIFINSVAEEERVRGSCPPAQKEDCEVRNCYSLASPLQINLFIPFYYELKDVIIFYALLNGRQGVKNSWLKMLCYIKNMKKNTHEKYYITRGKPCRHNHPTQQLKKKSY